VNSIVCSRYTEIGFSKLIAVAHANLPVGGLVKDIGELKERGVESIHISRHEVLEL
jgi:hypothetical protein